MHAKFYQKIEVIRRFDYLYRQESITRERLDKMMTITNKILSFLRRFSGVIFYGKIFKPNIFFRFVILEFFLRKIFFNGTRRNNIPQAKFLYCIPLRLCRIIEGLEALMNFEILRNLTRPQNSYFQTFLLLQIPRCHIMDASPY